MVINRVFASSLVFALVILAALSQDAFSQQPQATPVAKPFYININDAIKDRVHDVQTDIFGIQYTDRYGKWNEIPLRIYNWKREQVASMMMEKTFGLNYFNIKLTEMYDGWELNKIYICEFVDESGRKYELPIKPIHPLEKNDVLLDIVVNPVSFSCDGLARNTVEFYGKITGGKSPYKADWFVLNDSRTDFLYQPRTESIAKAGMTPVIEVDKNPDYYVLLMVQDACGTKQQKLVHLACEDGKKKINTLFVEKLTTSEDILIR